MTTKPQTVIPPGTAITQCPPRRAKGLKEQKMRAVGGTRLPINKRPVKEVQGPALLESIAALESK